MFDRKVNRLDKKVYRLRRLVVRKISSLEKRVIAAESEVLRLRDQVSFTRGELMGMQSMMVFPSGEYADDPEEEECDEEDKSRDS